MRFYFLLALFSIGISSVHAQTPKSYSGADILQELKKLEVFGSVLYIAAHPDDENTRLLAYLANEKKYRTGYLSLTRGDGGQNLIGDDQGIDLGLIRTQELLAARRIDGAQQFFTRAYDFGFSKNPEEALRIWGHDKILADVVWVIRNFKPDVIITRFPTTGEGGHGHHTASAILAGEAFEAAADPTKFPEQLSKVSVWTTKRLLWNTFNFGTTNTQREDQFKLDVGVYNALLGKSYGEIAAESRSQHKSQGFGVPAQRGSALEYFSAIKGDKPIAELLEGIDPTFSRQGFSSAATQASYQQQVKNIITTYDPATPQNSLNKLTALYRELQAQGGPQSKLADLDKLIAACSGIFMEVTAQNQLNVIGDSMKLQLNFNNRSGVPVSSAAVNVFGQQFSFNGVQPNVSSTQTVSIYIPKDARVAQPYWLVNPFNGGYYDVPDQSMIGRPEIYPYNAEFDVTIDGLVHHFTRPVQYKYTDPVKGELYEPMQLVNPVFVNSSPSFILFSNNKKQQGTLHYTLQSNLPFNEKASLNMIYDHAKKNVFDSTISFARGEKKTFDVKVESGLFPNDSTSYIGAELTVPSFGAPQYNSLNKISYDHIPNLFYNYYDRARVVKMDLTVKGSLAGYIAGAGDKVPDALQQMGYKVVMLTEADINAANLKQFDVIITGVRAYNIHAWLSTAYPVLMDYVKNGGILLTQYNTNNSIGPVKAKISPYPFTISRNRVTDETAKVNFLLPKHPALNYPNKITAKDFDGWIQERSIYNAENVDPAYERILSMKDPGETDQDGSLIIANYGKGRFVYTGLVFFRELPAGVPGAYRLFANLIAR
ncbi:MAG: LmbE family protein [Ferruginibacter sp.]|nr:LmbE family protein [Ferruginibacter sp.]